MEQFDNIDDVWTFFVTIIDWCLDQYFPLKRISCKTTQCHTPWMSDDIMAAIRQKNRAKHVAEKTGDTVYFSIYKRMKNSLKSMIRLAKLAYLHGLLQKSHKFSHMAAQLWSQVNAIIGRQSTFGGNLSLDKINGFFCSVALHPNTNPLILLFCHLQPFQRSFNFVRLLFQMCWLSYGN